jgi:UrcA family protein
MIRALVVSLLLAAPAVAAPIVERVRTADLDLSTDAGVAELDRRIRVAAASACTKPGGFTAWDRWVVRTCEQQAIAAAKDTRNAVVAAVRTQRLAAAN